jgi:TIR domain/NB-ARC domain/APAF-1 helical domain
LETALGSDSDRQSNVDRILSAQIALLILCERASMPNALEPRIFLSYARSDRDFAITLRDELLAAGLTLWHDLQDLEAGQWWSQISNAIESKAIEHIVLIASPDAQASRIVAQECWLAQREGKTASLVVPPQYAGKIDFKELPRFMQAAHHYNLTEPDQKAKFIERLRKPGQGPRRPRPEGRPKPPDYVARDKEYGQMRAALLDAGGEATTATVVLTGHGGFGKTTLATALVNDESVQQAYFNGILLLELGEGLVLLPKTYDGRKTLEGLIKAKVEALIKTLEDKDERFDALEAAKARLKEILDKRHGAVLLWIEDAWDAGHAKHFIDAAPNAAKLVTSRIRDILPDAATHIDVDELTDAEAAAFMAWGLDPKTDIERSGLRALATTTAGRWPILIRQINAQLKYQSIPQSGRRAQALDEAITSLQARLKREGLDDLDKSTDTNRATAVRLSVGVSFDMLREEDRHRKFQDGFHEARYLDLAGFQEAEVPIATIARLWGHLGVLRRAEAPTLDAQDEARRAEQERHWYAALRKESIDVLERLYALALLQKLDAGDDGMVRLHDVMRQYLWDKQKDALQAFHRQFVLAYDAESREAVTSMTDRERLYFYKWFPTHLHEAGKNERDDNGHRPLQQALDALLLTPNWMARKLQTCGALPLLQDYQAYSRLNLHAYVGRSISMALDAISRMPEQLGPQLVARLAPDDAPEAADFLEAVRQIFPATYLSVAWPTFTAPGAEVCRIQAHKAKITGLLPLDGSRFVSWASHWNYRQSPHLTEPLAQVCDLTSGRAVFTIGRKDEVIHCIARLT